MFGALLRKLGSKDEGPDLSAAYRQVVDAARQPHWYTEGAVEDTVDGRFEMVCALMSVTLIRLEEDGEEGQLPSVRLTEVFVDDMDGQLREFGIGDVVVGKHVGRMMGALGGRLSAYKEGLVQGTLDSAILRNLHRGEDRGAAARSHCASALSAHLDWLMTVPLAQFIAGTQGPRG